MDVDGSTRADVKALAEAFEIFTKTTRTMEESYRLLELRVEELDKELAAKNRELEVTRDYVEYIVESMSDGVIAVDTAGTITAFNRAAKQVLGYEGEAVVGRSFRERFGREFDVPQRRGAHGLSLVELRSKEGKDIPVSERNSPLSDHSGARIGTVKVFQDLSEIEALREQVRRMDRLSAIGEMAATVAHEIRNPLGGLRGFASLLARDIDEDDPRSRLVGKILEGAKGLDRVVTELLEYTQPVELKLDVVDCCDLIHSTLEYLDYDADRIRLDCEVEGGHLVYADGDKIKQVLLNLLLNAVQSIEGRGAIRVALENTATDVTIVVSDTGCGMSAKDIEKAFSPFYTTKEKGTGLGLASAIKIVEGHGGALKVDSATGRGSVFSIQLARAE